MIGLKKMCIRSKFGSLKALSTLNCAVGSGGAAGLQLRKEREMMYRRTKMEASAKRRIGRAIAIVAERRADSKD
jgi:hypothetical protein